MAIEVGHPLEVMCIDDCQVFCDSLADLSKIVGHNLHCFSNPQEALENFRDHPEQYDAVMVDMVMSLVDGEEVARNIRQQDRSLPIILMSVSLPEDTEVFEKIGINRYWDKDDVEDITTLLNEISQEKRRS